MGMFNSAGSMWSPYLVGWGKTGRAGGGEMPGIYNKKKDGTKGRPLEDQRKRQKVEVWDFPGIYALFKGPSLIYVGQAIKLGDRLIEHWKKDHLVGRWDAFSWASSNKIEWDKDGDSNDIIKSTPTNFPIQVATVEQFLDEAEAFAIFIGKPVENKQEPDLADDIKWIEQVRSEKAENTIEDMIREIYSAIKR